MKKFAIISLTVAILFVCGTFFVACKRIEHDGNGGSQYESVEDEEQSGYQPSEDSSSQKTSSSRTPVSPITDGGTYSWN